MKRERRGCLDSLMIWLFKVLLSLVLAAVCVALLFTFCYKNVKPFKAFVDGYPILQYKKDDGIPKIKVQFPKESEESKEK